MMFHPGERFRQWRCNFGQTANIATRTFRPLRVRRAFAAMSARSAPTASRASLQMSVRTAEADSRQGRSGPRGNGEWACRSRNSPPRPSACPSNTRSLISRRILREFGIFRPKSGRCLPSLRGANATKQSRTFLAAQWIASRSLSSGARRRDPLARNERLFRRRNRAFDFTKADAIAIALAPTAHDQ